MQEGNPNFYILPIVYIAPYPMMLPAFEQGYKTDRMRGDMKKQFSLPYPEDDNEE